ncbi:hypothetical protein MKEN_01304500 [Mycena kentingensis (nom. inval.)]|nr:hypothetical protein MKEN_01304500 [Mycena kentingensis (nom. inval.)]
MAPSEFSLRLQRGITGGFAPPTPSALFTVTQTPGAPSLAITSATREDGTPSLQEALPKSLTSDDATAELVDELYLILKSIPTEQPPGSEDIYGMDTSIWWFSEGFEWCNGGPAGCGGGTSTVQATGDDKAKFRRAVEIVTQLVEMGKAEEV